LASFLSILKGLANGLLDLVMLPWTIWQWANIEVVKERMIALTMAGKSVEFLYMMLSLVLVLIVVSLFSRRFLKSTVLSLEAFNRKVGQFAAWFVLLLMFQQVLIIVMGQVFKGNELLFSPFGMALSNAELQWLSGQLKFYNAILIAFASAYTFIEGGHVRVDLVYGNLGFRAKRFIDFLGSIIFMLPTTILLWWFSWPLAMNSIFAQRPMNIFSTKASWRGVKLETSGTAEFTWVWAFKVLILFFAALLFIQALAFMLRNLWALLSGDESIESHPPDPNAVDPEDSSEAPGTEQSVVHSSPDIQLDASNKSDADKVDVNLAQQDSPLPGHEMHNSVINAHDRFSSDATDKSTALPVREVSDRQRARVQNTITRRRAHTVSINSLIPAGVGDRTTRG